MVVQQLLMAVQLIVNGCNAVFIHLLVPVLDVLIVFICSVNEFVACILFNVA